MKSLNPMFAVAIILAGLGLSGCADMENQAERGIIANSKGDYHIIKYSGGKAVEDFWLHDIKVTQNEHTDGVFFIKDGNIYEVQGDVTTIRLAKPFQGPDIMPAGLI